MSGMDKPTKMAPLPMPVLRSRIDPRRHLAWLLWLALLLPLGQGAAAWHALSHTRADASGERDGKALHGTQCDLCLSAATVAGGALPGEPPALPSPSARHEAPRAPTLADRVATPARAYLSRAPPFASH